MPSEVRARPPADATLGSASLLVMEALGVHAGARSRLKRLFVGDMRGFARYEINLAFMKIIRASTRSRVMVVVMHVYRVFE